MLVLSRKENESILIGDNIRITVLQLERGKLKLGIETPPDVPVLREEKVDDNGRCSKNIYRKKA